jgi:hypothetical protein
VGTVGRAAGSPRRLGREHWLRRGGARTPPRAQHVATAGAGGAVCASQTVPTPPHTQHVATAGAGGAVCASQTVPTPPHTQHVATAGAGGAVSAWRAAHKPLRKPRLAVGRCLRGDLCTHVMRNSPHCGRPAGCVGWRGDLCTYVMRNPPHCGPPAGLYRVAGRPVHVCDAQVALPGADAGSRTIAHARRHGRPPSSLPSLPGALDSAGRDAHGAPRPSEACLRPSRRTATHAARWPASARPTAAALRDHRDRCTGAYVSRLRLAPRRSCRWPTAVT